MKILSKAGILLFFLFCQSNVSAQTISKEVCHKTFDLIKDAFTIAKIYREDVYDSDCDFEFTTDEKITVLISIEKFISVNESKAEVKRQWKETISGNKLKIMESDNQCKYDEIKAVKLVDIENWNDAYLNKSKSDNFLLLRRNNFVINMFSIDNPEILLRIEKIINLIKLD